MLSRSPQRTVGLYTVTHCVSALTGNISCTTALNNMQYDIISVFNTHLTSKISNKPISSGAFVTQYFTS